MRKFIVTFSAILALLVAMVLPIYAIDVPESVDTYYYDPANVLSEEVEYEISERPRNNHEVFAESGRIESKIDFFSSSAETFFL